MAFEVLPDSFDGIEVWGVGREVERLDVVSAESPFLFLRCGFFGHGVEESLNNFYVAVRHDQAEMMWEKCFALLEPFVLVGRFGHCR